MIESKQHSVLPDESPRLMPVPKRWMTPELQTQLREAAAAGKRIGPA